MEKDEDEDEDEEVPKKASLCESPDSRSLILLLLLLLLLMLPSLLVLPRLQCLPDLSPLLPAMVAVYTTALQAVSSSNASLAILRTLLLTNPTCIVCYNVYSVL